MMDSIISVIIPVYNCEKYLDRCIKSIIRQSYFNLEIIIIDDGSTDKTQNICNKYAENDNRIKYIKTENKGVAFARNTGLDVCNGDFVMFVDADDYIDLDMCDYMIRKMAEYNVDIVSSKPNIVDINGNNYLNRKKKMKESIINYDKGFNFTSSTAIFSCWGSLFKKNIIGNIRFDTDIYVAEDTLFFYKVLNNCGKYLLLEDMLYHYIVYNNSSINGRITEKKCTEIEGWKRIQSLVKNKNCIQEKSVNAALGIRASKLYRKSYNESDISEISKKIWRKIVIKYLGNILCYGSIFEKINALCISTIPNLYMNILVKIGYETNSEIIKKFRKILLNN